MTELTFSFPATNSEPAIEFSNGILTIQGRSIHTDSNQLYTHVIDMFYQYSKDPLPLTEININLEYLNSASNRSLFNLLIIAEHLYNEKKKIRVCWYYQPGDEIMYEQGKIFQELINIPIALIPL